MNYTGQIQLGRKKGYVITNRVGMLEVLVDCDVTNALVRIPMTADQFTAWQNKTDLTQNIFPELDKDVREILISGTTPAEWTKMFGGKKFSTKQLQKFGYEFDSE